MSENWDAKLIAHLGVGGALSIATALLAVVSPVRLAAAVPLAFGGGMNIALARHYQKRREVKAGELTGAWAELLSDYLAVTDEVPTFDAAEVVIRRITGEDFDSPVVSTKDLEWYGDKFICSSVGFMGGAGSGKSVNARHLADCIVAKHGLDSIFGLLSTHYETNPEKPLDRWFPGVPAEQLTNVVCRTKDANWARLTAFEKLMHTRQAAEDTTAPFRYLVIDDFQYQFPSDQKDRAAAIIESLIDEGRKYNLRLVIVLHSGKTKQVKLDSSVLWSMTMVVFQSALADPNMKAIWPYDISKSAGNLADSLATEARAAGGQYRVALVRPGSLDIGFDGAQIKLLPDRSQSGITFKMDERPWIDSATEQVLAGVEDGSVTSFTKALSAVGISRRHKNADGTYKDDRAQALWAWWDQTFNNVLPERNAIS